MDFLHREELQALRSEPVTAALVLVGHGSHRSPDSARPIHDLARRLRASGAFPEVRVAFWKEEPSLRHALDLVEEREILVVPVFTSEGYFTDHVVPRELGLEGPVTDRDGRRVRYLRPVGTHRRMAEVVLERAREAAPLSVEEASRAALVVVGHGTDRHPRSAKSTLDIVSRLRTESPYREVVPAFLDQSPLVTEVLAECDAPDIIVVPFFISEGWHAGTTLPRDLAISGGRARRGASTVWYALPVGTHATMTSVVRDLVADAGEWGDGLRERDESGSDVPAEVARTTFGEWIRSADRRRFLQVEFRRAADDRYELRHVDDSAQPPGDLLELTGPDDAMAVARVTEDGRYRPLVTSPDLRRGWRFPRLTEDQAWEVLSRLYATAFVHRVLAKRGKLDVTSFRETAGRQSGMYAQVGRLPNEAVARLVGRCCGPEHCLRVPVWHREEDVGDEGVPCPEPCSLFISAARDELGREP